MSRSKSKLCYHITVIAFLLIGFFGVFFQTTAAGKLFSVLCPLFLLIPFALNKLKIKIPYMLYTLFFIYLCLSYDIGFMLSGYEHIIYFDKAVHLYSGFINTIIGMCIFQFFRHGKERNNALSINFSLFFSISIGALSEFLEWFVYLVTGYDTQRVLLTGVNDTMLDLSACLCGAIICSFFYILLCYKKFSFFNKPILYEFCQLNNC